MRGSNPTLFYLLAFPAIYTLAHGHGMEHNQTHDAVSTDVAAETATEYADSYFSHSEHAALIYTHIAFMVVAWIFILPIAVMLSISRSRYTLETQLTFLATNAVGVTLAVLYNASTPDLYPNNAHHKIGWIITWVVSAHVMIYFTGWVAHARKKASICSDVQERLLSISPEDSTAVDCDVRYFGDFEVASDSSSFSARNSSNSTICADHCDSHNRHHKDSGGFETIPLLSSRLYKGLWPARVTKVAFGHIQKFCKLFYAFVDRIILPFGFLALATGIATFARFFEGHHIFGGLAHWIKGGVFFWLGLFNLGRWSGSFAELGWAWNLRPKNSASQVQLFRPSAELVESSLILFYGATNIFLEHLSGWGGEWTARDLEHMSITVLFIGGGLCGILIESTRIRDLLNMSVTIALTRPQSDEEHGSIDAPTTYDFSLNPIPALVILLLGTMMSSHHQTTMTSSMVHKQWGSLLLWASVARGLTYVLLYIKPPASNLPSRPPTELLASFGLIAGGLIFMASSSDSVEGMAHYNLDAMFLYTVTMGLVGLLMAWEIIVLAIKGWAARMEQVRC